MLNRIDLIGRMCADPEVKYTTSNNAVTTFSLAVERDYGDRENRVTDFLPIVAWRNTAEFIGKYYRKGDLIAISGSLQARTYEDKDGKRRTVYEVLADRTYPCNTNRNGSTSAQAPKAVNVTQEFEEIDIDEDDDLPF